VLNRTVSDARLSLVTRPGSPTRFLIACVQDARPAAFALFGTSLRLYVEHEVDIGDRIAHTASYRYVLQADDTAASWLLRWEYLRDRPPGYDHSLGHVHVRAELATALAAKPLDRLHLPTARVAFELVLRHVIAEWGVQPKTGDWSGVLEESLSGFEKRGTAS
jgi:hypothetical protein